MARAFDLPCSELRTINFWMISNLPLLLLFINLSFITVFSDTIMFKSATRIASAAPLNRVVPRAGAARRFISTAPPHQKSRSWKSSAARWGLAGALVYYYNTATAFAEEPHCMHDDYLIHGKSCTDRRQTLAMRHPRHHERQRHIKPSHRYRRSGKLRQGCNPMKDRPALNLQPSAQSPMEKP